MPFIGERADRETNLAVMGRDEIRDEIAALVGNRAVAGSSTANADANSWRKCGRLYRFHAPAALAQTFVLSGTPGNAA